MLPSTFQNANYLRFIHEMLEEYGKQHHKEIEFVHQGKLEAYNSNIGLTIFRIIQYLLKSSHTCGANNVFITIKTAETIKLNFADDGRNANALEPDRKLMLRHIETRLSLVKGTFKFGRDKKGNNVVDIEIPLDQDND
jgi:signal transduction histidine kinase